MSKELAGSIAETATEASAMIASMSITYKALVQEYISVVKERDELKEKLEKKEKKK